MDISMSSVVFFRAVNVGGHQTFRPGKLAKDLSQFGIVNIGAAGTFVVRGAAAATVLREEIQRRLPFQPELMICPAREVLALEKAKAFQGAPSGENLQQFVTVLQKTPRELPHLPFEKPAGSQWEVRIVCVTGRFVLSLRRPGENHAYSNSIVENLFSIPATTRNWNTFAAIWKVLSA